MRRLPAVAVGGLALFGAAWAGAAWLAERRHRNIFPSSQAQVLLNPLRRWIMPVAATLERFDIRPGQTVLGLAAAGADNAGLAVADAMHLPLATASVDRAFLVTVLGEVPDPDAALAELCRVLKPGGLLGFCESLGDPDIVFVGKLRNLCGRHCFEEVACYRNPLGYTAIFRTP